MNASNLYGMLGVQPMAGMGFVQTSGVSQGVAGSFAGEADVMMISGLGNDVPIHSTARIIEGPPPGVDYAPGAGPRIPTATLTGQLQVPVSIGTVTLPLWQWLLIAALLGGAGGYYLGRR